MDASVEEAVCHIRKVSEKSLDLASPVLLEERRDIVGLQSPLRCDNPNLSFISPPSSSGTSHSTSSSCKKRKPGRPRTYSAMVTEQCIKRRSPAKSRDRGLSFIILWAVLLG